MPTITTYDPLSSGAEAAGAYLDAANVQKAKALALAQAAEQQRYDRSRDTKADERDQRDFDERKTESGQSFGLEKQRTEAEVAHTKLHDSIDKASAEAAAKLAPLLQKAQELQNKAAAGQITSEKARTQALSIANQRDTIQRDIERKYGPQAAGIAIQQAQANIGSTMASTQSTFAATGRANALFPGDLQKQGLDLAGGAIANQGGRLENQARALQNAALGQAQPDDPAAEKNYGTAMASYNRKNSDFSKAVASGKITKQGDGYVDKAGNAVSPPAEPVSPSDFRASLGDEIDAINNPATRTDPQMPPEFKTASPAEYAAALIRQTQSNPALSTSQKRETVLAIKAATRNLPGGGAAAIPGGAGGALDLRAPRGGSQDPAPFLQSLGL